MQMNQFNNHAYESMLRDLINDFAYVDGMSNAGKISIIRRYAEVIVRRILNLPEEESVMLGRKEIRNRLHEHSGGSVILINAVENIRLLGNKYTHTQERASAKEAELRSVLDSLFCMYSYLFIDYFSKYKFGSNLEAASKFSILPPIIRYITLKQLHEGDHENAYIIDRLCLAMLKAYDEDKVKGWLCEREEKLLKIKTMSDLAVQDISEAYGPAVAQAMLDQAPNLFDLCMDRVTLVGSTLREKGRLYEDFESAEKLFREEGRVEGDTPEIAEFNSLMEFVYMGRKPKANDRLDNRDDYISLQ